MFILKGVTMVNVQEKYILKQNATLVTKMKQYIKFIPALSCWEAFISCYL